MSEVENDILGAMSHFKDMVEVLLRYPGLVRDPFWQVA